MDKEELIKFWKPAASGSGSTNFFTEIFNNAKLCSFLQTHRIFIKILSDKEIPVNFWKSFGVQIRTRFALI